MRRLLLSLSLCLLNVLIFATVFNATDGSFSISLPSSKWQKISAAEGSLQLKNGQNTIDISPLTECKDAPCIEKLLTRRVAQAKRQQLKLIKNTYSGEEIKKIEYPTLDQLFYFSYTSDGKNYTEGYFTSGAKGYKIEISGLSYADADLYLSFIAPKPKEIEDDLPIETEEDSIVEENITAPEIQETGRQTLVEAFANKRAAEKAKKLKLPKKLSIIIGLILIYLCVIAGFFTYNFIFPQKPDGTPTNPKSFYPIRGNRLYGAPDLFIKLYDSQGYNFIVTTTRWSSFLKEYGFYGAVFFALLHFAISSAIQQGLANNIWVNTGSSLCYLFVIFGLIFMIGGYILDILFPAPIFVYTEKGAVFFKIVRRRKGLFKYAYLVLSNAYSVIFRLETSMFPLKRKWVVIDKNDRIAVIQEKSLLRAIARKLFGHLGGSLRANYFVQGKNESKGQIMSLRNIKTNFQIDIDKTQAFPPSVLLAAAAVIFTKYRDKYYPWFN